MIARARGLRAGEIAILTGGRGALKANMRQPDLSS
jgi:hypothetical protein